MSVLARAVIDVKLVVAGEQVLRALQQVAEEVSEI
jgi:hypothetical protein